VLKWHELAKWFLEKYRKHTSRFRLQFWHFRKALLEKRHGKQCVFAISKICRKERASLSSHFNASREIT
ncbi:MAG TPA: hypothetical protein VGD31_12850, partial [Sphingobacteriaceae bacterium]